MERKKGFLCHPLALNPLWTQKIQTNPWTEQQSGLQSMGSKSQTQLNTRTEAYVWSQKNQQR